MVNNILDEYAALCEDESTTLSKIYNFRKENERYLSISDTDFSRTLDNLNMEIVNPDGLVFIGNQAFKYTGQIIQVSDIENFVSPVRFSRIWN